jgi:hypothetical protein
MHEIKGAIAINIAVISIIILFNCISPIADADVCLL